jgi:hypothetical protein
MGIAIHTGDVVVGNIGSDRRAKYGVVGPPVNITGRIESYSVGGQVLVSGETLEAAGDQVVVGQRTEIHAKGAKAPIFVYQLKGLGTVDAGLFVPEHKDPRTKLASPLRVRCWKLEGKTVSDEVIEGEIHELSASEAVLRAAVVFEALTNLKLRLVLADGSERDADVYVKVTESATEGSVLRFTAVPPDVEPDLKKLRT